MWIKSVDKIQETINALNDNVLGVYKVTMDNDMQYVFTRNGSEVKVIQHGSLTTSLDTVTNEMRNKLILELG